MRDTVLALSATLVALVPVAGCASTTSTPVRHVAPTAAAPTTSTLSTSATTAPSAVPTTVPTPVVPTVGWSHPATSLPPAGGFTSLSCISDVFCLAAGGGSNQADAAGSSGPGVVASWDGAVWSSPTTYFAASPGSAPPPWLPAIACTDGPMCAVVDGSGHTSLGDGTNWWPPLPLAAAPVSAPDPGDPGPGHPGSRTAAVACPSSQVCAYVDNTGHVATMHGTTWGAPQVFTSPGGATTVALFQTGRVAVACASSSWCTALVAGVSLDWNGTSWTASAAPWGADAGTGDTAVSCPAPGTCTAVHGSDVSTRVPGSGWSPPRAVDGGGLLDALACPSPSVCVAADASGDVLRSTAGSWGPPQKVVTTPSAYTGDGTSLSCPTEQFCMVLTGDGDFATYQGATPSAAATTVPATTVPTGD